MEVHGRTHMPEETTKLNKLSKLRREMTDLFHLFIYLLIHGEKLIRHNEF